MTAGCFPEYPPWVRSRAIRLPSKRRRGCVLRVALPEVVDAGKSTHSTVETQPYTEIVATILEKCTVSYPVRHPVIQSRPDDHE